MRFTDMWPSAAIQLPKYMVMLRHVRGARGALYFGITFTLAWFVAYVVRLDPDESQGILMGIFWASVVGMIFYRRERLKPDGYWWWKLLLAGLLARLTATLLHLAVGLWFYRGAVDFGGYYRRGIGTGTLVLRAFFGDPDALTSFTLDRSIELLHALFYFLTGPSLVGMFFLSGIVGFVGAYLFIRAFQVALSREGDTRFLAVSLFLLPSIVFWASLLGKDSWVFFFLGLISYCFALLLRRFDVRYLVGMLGAIGTLTMIRPPVGAVIALAVGLGWFGWFLRWRSAGPVAILRPVFLTGSVLVVGTVALILVSRSIDLSVSSEIDSVEGVASAAARAGVRLHQVQAEDVLSTGSGSNVPIVFTEATPGGVVRALPMAMFTALFRPFIFEAHNPLALGAALETTFLVGLIFWRRRNLGAAIRAVFAEPFVGFCLASFLLLILIVSMEGNLGAIARHRTMALPFLLGLLAVARAPRRPRRTLGL